MVIPPEEGGIKEKIDSYNNVIIIYSMLHNISVPQLKKMSAQYKVMCGCECFIDFKGFHLSLLLYKDGYFKKSIPNPQFAKQKVW